MVPDETRSADELDIQIESYPPGNYLYMTQLSVIDLVRLIDVFAGPTDRWPQQVRGND